MLKIHVPASELFDNATGTFIPIKAQTLQLEHSLVSLSKWESKWCEPFLTREQKTTAKFTDYIRCMTLTQNVDPNVYLALNLAPDILRRVRSYIDAPMTATTFSQNSPSGGMREVVTAEIIYYWMICHGIPFECQKWHLNRLLTLIRVCSAKSQPPKKIPKGELMARNRAINAARRRKHHTRG